jgi:starch synthase
MPSRFEPGGLGQLIAMRYGAVPVVRAGGAQRHRTRGEQRQRVSLCRHTPEALGDAVQRAVTCYHDHDTFVAIQQRNMREDFTWGRSSKAYIHLYQQAIQHRKGHA